MSLSEGKASDRALADAAEIEGTFMLYDVCDLRIALGRSVLQVLNYAAILIQSEHK
jgi:hypothetical protein